MLVCCFVGCGVEGSKSEGGGSSSRTSRKEPAPPPVFAPSPPPLPPLPPVPPLLPSSQAPEVQRSPLIQKIMQEAQAKALPRTWVNKPPDELMREGMAMSKELIDSLPPELRQRFRDGKWFLEASPKERCEAFLTLVEEKNEDIDRIDRNAPETKQFLKECQEYPSEFFECTAQEQAGQPVEDRCRPHLRRYEQDLQRFQNQAKSTSFQGSSSESLSLDPWRPPERP
ncbi:MAG: hypothetical protein RMJ84_12680, partial [Sandaracinaceae bacterium]|nr:hypothetical protein [Sandaracinaceae bacterium]